MVLEKLRKWFVSGLPSTIFRFQMTNQTPKLQKRGRGTVQYSCILWLSSTRQSQNNSKLLMHKNSSLPLTKCLGFNMTTHLLDDLGVGWLGSSPQHKLPVTWHTGHMLNVRGSVGYSPTCSNCLNNYLFLWAFNQDFK